MKTQQQTKTIWKEITLGEIAECLDNKRVPITQSYRKIGNVPYYGANGQQDSVEDFIFNEELLLLAEDGGSWGYKEKCSYIINGKSWVNNHAHVLKVSKDLAEIKFLMYWFNLTDLNEYISGTTRGKLNQKAMKSIKIPLPFSNGKPDLETQKQIVAILEKAENLKQKQKKQLELYDEYLKSVFYEMFLKKDFDEKELCEITKIISGSTPRTSKQEYWNGEINWITPAELIDGDNYYYYETQRKITSEGLKSCSTELFPKGTVMLTTRAPIGKVAIAGSEMCSNQGFKNFIPSDNIISEYLYFWFLTKKEFLNSQGSGATFKELSRRTISKIKIPLPPLSLQQKFAAIVEKVEKLKEKQKKSLEDSEELFNALMQKAFSGGLN